MPSTPHPTGPVLVLVGAPHPSPPPLLSPLQSFLSSSPNPPKTHILSLSDYLNTPAIVPGYETAAYDLERLHAALGPLMAGGEQDGNTLIILHGTAPLFLLDLKFGASIKIWQDVAADVSLSRAVLASQGKEELDTVLARWVKEKEGWEGSQREARKRADLIVPEGEGKGVEVVGGAVLDEVIARQIGEEKPRGTIIVGRGDAQEMAYYDTV